MRPQPEDAASDPTHLTDAEGRFEIADLAAGRYDLEVRAAGFAPAKVPGVRVPEGAGEVDFGTVVLVLGASIEGWVTDGDGAAIAGADVTADLVRQGFIGVSPSSPQDQTKTDAEGRFVVADLLPGQPVTLAVTKEGYGSESVSDLRPPTDEPLAIVLRPAGRLKGKVVDKRGDPIQGATVMAYPDPRVMASATVVRRQGRPAWARTGVDGRFLIEDVEPGTLQVTADAESYQRQVRQGIEVAAGADLVLDLVLEAGAVVEGTVTTADGAGHQGTCSARAPTASPAATWSPPAARPTSKGTTASPARPPVRPRSPSTTPTGSAWRRASRCGPVPTSSTWCSSAASRSRGRWWPRTEPRWAAPPCRSRRPLSRACPSSPSARHRG